MDKNKDLKGRWRNVIVSFRMSPEERDDLNARVKLSGLTKQDYVIKRLLEREKRVNRANFLTRRKTRRYRAIKSRKSTQPGGVNEQY